MTKLFVDNKQELDSGAKPLPLMASSMPILWHEAETTLLRMRRVGSEYFHWICELFHDATDSGQGY